MNQEKIDEQEEDSRMLLWRAYEKAGLSEPRGPPTVDEEKEARAEAGPIDGRTSNYVPGFYVDYSAREYNASRSAWAPPFDKLNPNADDNIAQVGVQLPNGLAYIDYKIGEGTKTPTYGQYVRFHFAMYRIDKNNQLELVDSSFERQQALLTLHGNGRLQVGLDECLHTMKPGGKRRVIVPPSLGQIGGPPKSPVHGPLPANMWGRQKWVDNVKARRPFVFDVYLDSFWDDRFASEEFLDGEDAVLTPDQYEDLLIQEARDKGITNATKDDGEILKFDLLKKRTTFDALKINGAFR